ncbi:MAG: alpha/beta hydrolase [Chloroflexi bacterium]|nr:alpha/beta hydrolase [Chloroflexota bacterium]
MKTNIKFLSGGKTIYGNFFSASTAANSLPTILLLAGFPGNETDVLGLGEVLPQYQLNVLTFNYRGTYQSEGQYSLKNTQEDIRSAFEFLQKDDKLKINPKKLVLGGWSYGGGMALTYAANHPEVNHVFSIAGTDHGEFAREYVRNNAFSTMVDEIFDSLKSPQGPVNFSGKAAIKQELIQNPDPYDLTSRAAQLSNRNLLLLGGWDDLNVVFEHHVLPLYRSLKKEGAEKVNIKAFQDNHAFENSRKELATTISNWIKEIFK